MKRTVLIMALVIAGITAKAQDIMKTDVPSSVSSAFDKKFPGMNNQDVDWDKEGGNFQAEFEMEGKEYEVLFDNQGSWLSTEIEKINASELPESISKQLNTGEYSTWEIDDIMVKENPEETIYEIEVEKGMKDHNLYFDKSGKQVKKKS